MSKDNDKRFIGWLELAISPEWQSSIATIHPVDLNEAQQCFGVTVDHHWLCGSDGSVTLFDSITAATRFLNLLNVDRIAKGGRRNRDVAEEDTVQCFQLDIKGITPCKKRCAAVEAWSQSTPRAPRMEYLSASQASCS